MKLLFWNRKQAAALDEAEVKAASVHKKNITKIVETRKKADTLSAVLKQNNITLRLAKAMVNH